MNTIPRSFTAAAIAVAMLIGLPAAALAAPHPSGRADALQLLFDPIDSAMCRAGKANHEIIRFTTPREPGLSFYGRVSLTCGNEAVGYMHIKQRHAGDWLTMLTKYGGRGAWDDFMSFATAEVLAHPSLVRNVGGGKYCYTAPIQLYQGGKLVKTFYPKVIVSTTTRRVITSYPHYKGC